MAALRHPLVYGHESRQRQVDCRKGEPRSPFYEVTDRLVTIPVGNDPCNGSGRYGQHGRPRALPLISL